MSAPPGRGCGVIINPGTPFAFTNIERGTWQCDPGGGFGVQTFLPAILGDVVVSQALPEPVSASAQSDSLTLRVPSVGPIAALLDTVTAQAEVTVLREVEGETDVTTDVQWFGIVRKRDIKRKGSTIELTAVDPVTYFCADQKLLRRVVDEATYPSVAKRHKGQKVPMYFGDFTDLLTVDRMSGEALCFNHGGWIDGATGATDPLYVYQDTLDLNGDALDGYTAGFKVFTYDSQVYSTPLEAYNNQGLGAFTEITAAVTGHLQNQGVFALDVSALGGATWDAERYPVLVQFLAPTVNDATVTGAMTVRGNKPITCLIRLMVEHCGMDAALFDLSGVDAIENVMPRVRRPVVTDESVLDLVAWLEQEAGIERYVTTAGLIAWRIREEQATAALTVTAADCFVEPDVEHSPWEPFFTSCTPTRDIWFPVAPEYVFAAAKVPDAAAITEHGSDVHEVLPVRWLREPSFMTEYADRVLAVHGERVELVRFECAVEDDLENQMKLRPGDAVSFSYIPSDVDADDDADLIASGSFFFVLAVEHNVTRWTTKVTAWRAELMADAIGNIYLAGGSTAQNGITNSADATLTGFASAGVASGTVVSAASDSITFNQGGKWGFLLTGDGTLSAADLLTFRVAINGSASDRVRGSAQWSGAERQGWSAQGVIEGIADGDVGTAVVRSTSGTVNLTPVNMSFTAWRIGT